VCRRKLAAMRSPIKSSCYVRIWFPGMGTGALEQRLLRGTGDLKRSEQSKPLGLLPKRDDPARALQWREQGTIGSYAYVKAHLSEL